MSEPFVRKAYRAARNRCVRWTHRFIGFWGGSLCPVCGKRRVEARRTIISDELAKAWDLTPDWRRRFNEREGIYCPLCGCNRRAQFLAVAVLKHALAHWGVTATSFAEMVMHPGFRALEIAECNACGDLHGWLARHPRLAYSEFMARPPNRSENLMHLTYADNRFDLLLTSETLEHVPDWRRALTEIRRVLKPGGVHIFTVPVVWDRPTSRCCAVLDDHGRVHNLRPPYHHGLPGMAEEGMMVITEFGADIVEGIRQTGFDVSVEQDAENPALCAFIARRPLNG